MNCLINRAELRHAEFYKAFSRTLLALNIAPSPLSVIFKTCPFSFLCYFSNSRLPLFAFPWVPIYSRVPPKTKMALQGAGPEAEGKKKFQGAVLKPESNASDFTIYHRTESGEPKPRYSPQHEITTCVVKAIKICQAMLRQQAARDGLTRLAKEYCAAREQRWFLREFPDTPENLMIVVNDFLDLVLARFPNVLVDYSLKNPDFGGGHWRRAFTGDFEISDQFIYLNGPVRES